VVFLICPIPFNESLVTRQNPNINDMTGYLKYNYLSSDYMLIAMWARCFFILRAIFNYNLFSDLYSKKLCKSYGFTANVRFAFKCLMKSDPGITVAGTLGASVGFFAFVLRVFELPYYDALGQVNFRSFFDAIWCVIITMTTVGYGDEYPATTGGQWVIIVTSLWGTFLISLLILSVADIFALDINE